MRRLCCDGRISAFPPWRRPARYPFPASSGGSFILAAAHLSVFCRLTKTGLTRQRGRTQAEQAAGSVTGIRRLAGGSHSGRNTIFRPCGTKLGWEGGYTSDEANAINTSTRWRTSSARRSEHFAPPNFNKYEYLCLGSTVPALIRTLKRWDPQCGREPNVLRLQQTEPAWRVAVPLRGELRALSAGAWFNVRGWGIPYGK
ncbi:hypothetical protein PHYSODRAFT_304312 [Phytophthora sojae]|uniref:Uncharacterized protein n=1 Tax=Phytophthora sojae (strain P6497) TaxID=1094619 RepID=G4ZZQ1_PHYSP|nr:hypothetical protein PHYSODRAFT_304312 [Phytophthora sojae]EGZ10397.1 hypothetical protein PHYSODRAFT_304312 [Phytophthora sojae]|eukprot:XP_009533142.1 hypothetical protein PHYSODRAFT_304312 [Phytophthora sojae]